MTWLPGAQRVVIPGAMGQTHLAQVRKLCWHTTEGGSIEGAVSVYLARRVPPHLTVDPDEDRVVQHIPLDRAAYALHAVDQTGVIQVEIVGYAREARYWSDTRLRWLGERVAAPIFEACPAINRHLVVATRDELTNTDPPLASARSPIRMRRLDWDRFTGMVTHQVAPAPNNHWDPGALDLTAIAAHGRAALATPEPPEEDDVDLWAYINACYAEAGFAPTADAKGRRFWLRDFTARQGADRAQRMQLMEQLLKLEV